MKKLFLTILVLPFSLFALPVNNPEIATLLCDGTFFSACSYGVPTTTCDVFSVRVGYYGDFIFNNTMEIDTRSM